MDYTYIKALHIIFIVTWFSGLFYIVRLFIYHREAQDKIEPEKSILSNQFSIMSKRLWLGITWPSAILTLILGTSVLMMGNFHKTIFEENGRWLLLKLIFVIGLYMYHFSLHIIYQQQQKGIFKYSSQQLRIWNEVATIFLLAIVMLVVVKQEMSLVYGVVGIIIFIVFLMMAIKIYKKLRSK
jgi:putative membrane protein